MYESLYRLPPSRRSKGLAAIGSAAFSLLTSLFQGCHNSEDAPKEMIIFDCNLSMQLKFGIFDRMTTTNVYVTFITTTIVEVLVKWKSSLGPL